MSNTYKLVLVSVLFCIQPMLAIAGSHQRQDYVQLSLNKELDFKSSSLSTVELGREYNLKAGFTFAGELNIYKFWNTDYSTIGIGMRPAIKFYFVKSHDINLFTEVKGGILYMLPEYSRTAINYTFLSNIGIDIKLKNRYRLRVGGGYVHFSNGHTYGDATNPTWDGFGGFAGWIF